MNKDNNSLIPLITAAGVAVFSLGYIYWNSSVDRKVQEEIKSLEQKCSLQKLLVILEEMRIKYTPDYIHYYHMLLALNKEYKDKPHLRVQIKTRIETRLEEKTNQIQ